MRSCRSGAALATPGISSAGSTPGDPPIQAITAAGCSNDLRYSSTRPNARNDCCRYDLQARQSEFRPSGTFQQIPPANSLDISPDRLIFPVRVTPGFFRMKTVLKTVAGIHPTNTPMRHGQTGRLNTVAGVSDFIRLKEKVRSEDGWERTSYQSQPDLLGFLAGSDFLSAENQVPWAVSQARGKDPVLERPDQRCCHEPSQTEVPAGWSDRPADCRSLPVYRLPCRTQWYR